MPEDKTRQHDMSRWYAQLNTKPAKGAIQAQHHAQTTNARAATPIFSSNRPLRNNHNFLKEPSSLALRPVIPRPTVTPARIRTPILVDILLEHAPPQRTLLPLRRPRAQIIRSLPGPRGRSRRRHHRGALHHADAPMMLMMLVTRRRRSSSAAVSGGRTKRAHTAQHPLPLDNPAVAVAVPPVCSHPGRRRHRRHGRVADLPEVGAVPLREVGDPREDFISCRGAGGGGGGAGGRGRGAGRCGRRVAEGVRVRPVEDGGFRVERDRRRGWVRAGGVRWRSGVVGLVRRRVERRVVDGPGVRACRGRGEFRWRGGVCGGTVSYGV